MKAASSKATVGSAYEMAPAYPKTDSEGDRAAAARYHAMNNVFFLEADMNGRYAKAFVGEPPYGVMGVKPGDEKLLYAPLDWVGFHCYTRRIVSDASKEKFQSGGNFSGTEIESNSPGGRDPYTRFRTGCLRKVLLQKLGWKCGRAESTTSCLKFHRSTAIPALRSVRAAAVTLMARMNMVAFQMSAAFSGIARPSPNWLSQSPRAPGYAPSMPGHYSTISIRRKATPSVMD